MISDRLISLVVYLEEERTKKDLLSAIEKFNHFIKDAVEYFELVIITRGGKYCESDWCRHAVQIFSNVVVINPLEKIDGEIAVTIGVKNSIGELVIVCRRETRVEEIDNILKDERGVNLIGRSESGMPVNVYAVNRKTINSIISLDAVNPIILFERSLLGIGNPYAFIKIVQKPRSEAISPWLFRIGRTIYNYHLFKITIIIATLLLIIEFSGMAGYAEAGTFLWWLYRSLIYVLFIIVTSKVIRNRRFNGADNYELYRSNFTHINSINLEK